MDNPMLERFLGTDEPLAASWSDMGIGAPTLIALAQLCSRAIAIGHVTAEDLTSEAKAILYAAHERGIIEVKCSNAAYESPSRLLTIYVETDTSSRIRFRDPRDPQQNILFLDGFRQLCANGLVMHHLYHEFSLTAAGFNHARQISPEGLETLLELGQAFGRE